MTYMQRKSYNAYVLARLADTDPAYTLVVRAMISGAPPVHIRRAFGLSGDTLRTIIVRVAEIGRDW